MASAVGLMKVPPIREPKYRMHLPLNMTAQVATALRSSFAALGGEECTSSAGLSQQAQLVELSVMLSLPGAKAQAAHSDISPLAQRRMCTLWCALQDVHADMGPITIFPADPQETAARHDWAALMSANNRRNNLNEFGTTFSADGERCEDQVKLRAMVLDEGGRSAVPLGESLSVEMGTGDALLLDCRTFHYGGANQSGTWRAQLSATFREIDHGEMAGIDGNSLHTSPAGDEGFTHVLLPGLAGKYQLGDFLDQTRIRGNSSATLRRKAPVLATNGKHDSSSSDGTASWIWELAPPVLIAAVLSCLISLGPAAEIAERESPADAASHFHRSSSANQPPIISEADYDALMRDGYVVVDGLLSHRTVVGAAKDAAASAFETTAQHSASIRTDQIVWIREHGEHSCDAYGNLALGSLHAVHLNTDVKGEAMASEQKPGDALLSALRCLRTIPLALDTHRQQRATNASDDRAHPLNSVSLGVPRSAQLAMYPPPQCGYDAETTRGGGARYRAHRDTSMVPWYNLLGLAQSAGVNCREVTVILYLCNPDSWAESAEVEHGGELLLYLGADPGDQTGETAKRVVSVAPVGGRIVVFDSRTILHEVQPHCCKSPRIALTLWAGGRHSQFDWLRKWGLTN